MTISLAQHLALKPRLERAAERGCYAVVYGSDGEIARCDFISPGFISSLLQLLGHTEREAIRFRKIGSSEYVGSLALIYEDPDPVADWSPTTNPLMHYIAEGTCS